MAIGLIAKPLPLIRNQFSVTVGIVSMLLPFLVLPPTTPWSRSINACCWLAKGWAPLPCAYFGTSSFHCPCPGCWLRLDRFRVFAGFYVVPALLGGGSEQFFSQTIYFWIRSRAEFGYGAAMGWSCWR